MHYQREAVSMRRNRAGGFGGNAPRGALFDSARTWSPSTAPDRNEWSALSGLVLDSALICASDQPSCFASNRLMTWPTTNEAPLSRRLPLTNTYVGAS